MMKRLYILNQAIFFFALEMLSKLTKKSIDGWTGWNRKSYKNKLIKDLKYHVEKKQWIDVGNYAMFLWNLDNKK